MQTLQQLVEAFRLYAVCEPCQRVANVDLPTLIEQEGGNYPIDRVRMRLSCTQCNTRSQALRIVYVGPEGRAAGFRYNRSTSANGSLPVSSQLQSAPADQPPAVRGSLSIPESDQIR